MRIPGRLAALLILGFALAGCAIESVPFDRTTAGTKTIGIVPARVPGDAVMHLATNVGMHFGLIGALVEAGMQANREADFRRATAGENFRFAEEFSAQLAKALEALGYVTVQVPANRSADDFLAKYPDDPRVDAYLDVIVQSYGYVAAGIGNSTPFRPHLALQARLIGAKDQALLMQDTVVYNPILRGSAISQHVLTVPPDAEFAYTGFADLVAQPDSAVRGLRAAVEKSVQALAGRLR